MVFYKILFPDIDLIFSISITNVTMLDSNLIKSYVTPALPEIVSMHKVRLEFPSEGWSYIFVETKKRLHKFCPCSVLGGVNAGSSKCMIFQIFKEVTF